MSERDDALWPVDLEECRLWPMEGDDGPLLQELFDDLTDYSSTLGDRGAADAISTFIALPEGLDYDAKLLLGLWRNGGLIGALDCIMGYPSKDQWSVGLLVVAERHRGQGVGSSVLRRLESTARDRGANRLRFGLREGNATGRSFLEYRGYVLDPTATTAPGVVLARKEL